jgi:hypothetical protein
MMVRRRPLNIEEENEAFDRIDALIASASNGNAELQRESRPSRASTPAPTPPVERILGVAEELLLVRVALEREATVTPALRDSLEHALRDVGDLCDDWGFATARVRVDFMRDDLRRGAGDLKSDIAELVRHLRYDARSWNPNHGQRTEQRYSTQAPRVAFAADRRR